MSFFEVKTQTELKWRGCPKWHQFLFLGFGDGLERFQSGRYGPLMTVKDSINQEAYVPSSQKTILFLGLKTQKTDFIFQEDDATCQTGN